MENIHFENEEEFNKSTIFFANGAEVKIYRYKNLEQEVLIKKYYDATDVNIDKVNRVRKVNSEKLIKPECLVYIDNQNIGFATSLKKGFYPIKVLKKDMDEEQKYNLIQKLKEEIKNLRNQNCTYGDINLNNVITDGDDFFLSDTLNVKIDEFYFDAISLSMSDYIKKRKTTNGIECYLLNLLTIYLFNDVEYGEIVNLIEEELINLFNKKDCNQLRGVCDNEETVEICYNILSTNICDKFLIDSIILKSKTY